MAYGTFDYIRANLERCNKHHARYTKASEGLLCPKRLIQLPRQGTTGVRFTIKNQNEGVSYAALSHCWGPVGMLRTLSSNFVPMQEEIDWEALPNMFRGSMITCQKLRIELIWIDALCIIQDDAADWAEESTKIGSYYGGAYLTIAASLSSSSEISFLEP